MPNLYIISTKNNSVDEDVSASEKFSVVYHDLFDYPLNFSDLIRWQSGKQLTVDNPQFTIARKNGFSFVEGHEGIVYKRILRERISKKKLEIAKKASRILSFIPSIKMVAVTGSLAMGNSTDESDIDLMVVTKKGSLWTTRLLSYFVLSTMHYALRRPTDANQKDKLCLNMWMDEDDLVWKKNDRNVYSSHEIGQILPLINKNKIYEKLLEKNKWILDYWPQSVKIQKQESESSNHVSENLLFLIRGSLFAIIEKLAFKLQYLYMEPKMTREVATATCAFFHPQDWGGIVLSRLSS